MTDNTPKPAPPLSHKALAKAAARGRTEADWGVRQKPYPTPAVDWVPSSVPDLRRRLDALTAACLDQVEKDGVMVKGEPHLMLDVIPALVEAGTNLRKLALARRLEFPAQIPPRSLNGSDHA